MSDKNGKDLQTIVFVGLFGAFSIWKGYWHFVSLLPAPIIGILLDRLGCPRKIRVLVELAWMLIVGGTVIVITEGWFAAAIVEVGALILILGFEWITYRDTIKAQKP